jgi:hypothetical protein
MSIHVDKGFERSGLSPNVSVEDWPWLSCSIFLLQQNDEPFISPVF